MFFIEDSKETNITCMMAILIYDQLMMSRSHTHTYIINFFQLPPTKFTLMALVGQRPWKKILAQGDIMELNLNPHD